jgi:hypothetical protein
MPIVSERSVAPPGRIRDKFETVRAAVRAILNGNADIAMVCGEPGIGKTETIRQELKRNSIAINRCSPANVFAFVDKLYAANQAGCPVIVLDDCDVLLSDERTANVAKMAFEDPRLVVLNTIKASNNERRRQEGDSFDPDIAPPRFRNNTRLIWLTNKNLTDPRVARTHLRSDFRALVSRGPTPIWVGSQDRQELFDYTLWLGTEGNMLRAASLLKGDQRSGGCVVHRASQRTQGTDASHLDADRQHVPNQEHC